MSAQDYPVTFGYGAQDGKYYGPNGSVGLMHRGNDRATPIGTLIKIGNTTIGKTGNSGVTGGPHLHTQAGIDKACQNTFDPTPLEFKGGTVVATGVGSQWGKYITLQVGDKFITYCHLSEVLVKVGDKIGGDMISKQDFDNQVKANQERAAYVTGSARRLAQELGFEVKDHYEIPEANHIIDEAVKGIAFRNSVATARLDQINELINNQDDDAKTIAAIKKLINKEK